MTTNLYGNCTYVKIFYRFGNFSKLCSPLPIERDVHCRGISPYEHRSETFKSTLLTFSYFKAISDLRWNVPTDIQQAVIPLILEKKNLSVQARTGSGKTAAFAIPIIHMILESKTSALIITPTKELCDQITKDVKSLCKYASREVSVVDVAQTQLHRKRLNFEDLAFLVVDEADLVLAFGYGKDIQELKSYLPKTHLQVLPSMKQQKSSGVLFTRGSGCVLNLRKKIFCPLTVESSKYAILIAMIRLKLIRGKTMIFTNSIDRCYKFFFRLRIFLEEFGVQTVILNSELPIATRCHTVQQFNRGLYDYLLATDENDSADHQRSVLWLLWALTTSFSAHKICSYSNFSKDREYGVSRGIDFKLVSNVINFDFPLTAKRYVHRVGRTARADQMGTALSFVSNAEEPRLIEVAALLTRGLQPGTRTTLLKRRPCINKKQYLLRCSCDQLANQPYAYCRFFHRWSSSNIVDTRAI
ncbi:unnamed protein product [Schistocephalus solidus]|uniref:RNA helicase n=1 Tax=Schistocephalus solidus TaxID=70667 RepID=A0A183SKU5_SCHSO|nr:unnamed protein product [Schistocephalus solidus]